MEAKEQEQPLYIAFVDINKAFDTVNQDYSWELLGKFGLPPKADIAYPGVTHWCACASANQ